MHLFAFGVIRLWNYVNQPQYTAEQLKFSIEILSSTIQLGAGSPDLSWRHAYDNGKYSPEDKELTSSD